MKCVKLHFMSSNLNTHICISLMGSVPNAVCTFWVHKYTVGWLWKVKKPGIKLKGVSALDWMDLFATWFNGKEKTTFMGINIHLSRSINLVGTFYGSLHWVLQLARGVGGYLLPVFSFGYFHIPNELAIVIVKWEYFWYF